MQSKKGSASCAVQPQPKVAWLETTRQAQGVHTLGLLRFPDLAALALVVFLLLLSGPCAAIPKTDSGDGSSAAQQAKPVSLDAHASGVFLNEQGDVLTAFHAVQGCNVVYVVKDHKVVIASVLANSPDHDLAVLGTSLTPYLSAVFPINMKTQRRSQGVFAESYNVVQRMPNRASIVFNAMSDPTQTELSLLSPVQPGSSGTPVLSQGLVLGVVVERVAPGPIASSTTSLSQLGRGGGTKGLSQVKATSTEHIKRFLLDNGIPFTQSNEPQLGRLQAQAPRAATLTVGIICG